MPQLLVSVSSTSALPRVKKAISTISGVEQVVTQREAKAKFEWEKLSAEERMRKVVIRMQNLGKYRGIVAINNAKLRGDS